MTHTTTPWKTNKESKVLGGIPITDSVIGDITIARVTVFKRKSESEANAEFIVLAVNSHEALVNALSSWVDTEQEAHFETQGHDVASCHYCIAVEALKLAGEL